MTKTRFDLEQEIMDCWSIVEDLKTVRYAVIEQGASTDRIDNMLLGLSELYGTKFEIMFRTFEELVSRRTLDQNLARTENSDKSMNGLSQQLLAQDDDFDSDGRC